MVKQTNRRMITVVVVVVVVEVPIIAEKVTGQEKDTEQSKTNSLVSMACDMNVCLICQ